MNKTVHPQGTESSPVSQEGGESSYRSIRTFAGLKKSSLGASFWLLVVYFAFEYARPQHHWPLLATLKVGMVLSILLGIAWLAKGDKSILKDPLIVLDGLFILLVASTVVFAVNTFWVYQTTKFLALYLFAATLPTIAFLGTRERIVKFFNIWIAIHVWLALESITETGRGSGGFLSDENDWALALNMVLPYTFYLSQSPHCSKVMKVVYLAAFAIFVLAIISTHSRGGFLGLVTVIAGLLFFSRNRIRNLLILLSLGSILLFWVPTQYFHEVQSISNPEDLTRKDRFYSWRLGWQMFRDHPILGVGAGNYPWKVGEYEAMSPEYDPVRMRGHGGRVAHSLYFTLLSELGVAGVLIFSMMVTLAVRRLFRVGRIGRWRSPQNEHLSDIELLARAMLISLAAYLACGAFISILYYPHIWYLIGFILAIELVSRASVAEGDNGGAHRPVGSNSLAPGSLD